jgi:hypothetical protein
MRVSRVVLVAGVGVVLAASLIFSVAHGPGQRPAQPSRAATISSCPPSAPSCGQPEPERMEAPSLPPPTYQTYEGIRSVRLGTYLGSHWVLSGLLDGDHEVSLRDALPRRASLDFSTGDRFWIDDTVNSVTGRFHRTATTFTTTSVGSTLAGYAGGDLDRLALLDALSLVASGPQVVVLGGMRNLFITAGRYRLQFDWAGPSLQPARSMTALPR